MDMTEANHNTSEANRRVVSVIIPCRSEAAWILRCLESIAKNDYPRDRLEILVVDGMSDDGTRAIVEECAVRYAFLRLLDNPQRITPAALNIGIAAARGDIIVRVDAHYEYPPHYISRLVAWLLESGADNVGGVVLMTPANDTAIARAIAVAVCHPFGVGNAYYRIGTKEPRWVDTVPFGCYRREVFDRVGLFDEDMVRNQDIEFNLRLRKAGGSILLIPDVVLHGHARGTLAKMARMYYQYGYFNPLVIQKVGSRISFRQAVPLLFVLSLLVCGVGAFLSGWMLLALIAILTAYAIPVAACSLQGMARHGALCGLAIALVLPTLHISNGLGTLKGMIDFCILRKQMSADRVKSIPLTR